MTDTKLNTKIHPEDVELADFLEGALPDRKRQRLEDHIAGCDECLAKIVSAHESADVFNKRAKPKKGKGKIMKHINLYLVLAIASFALSFLLPGYFLQLLAATILLGTKWIVDSKTTKMLVTIYEAWKTGGEKEASRIMEKIDSCGKKRF
ncbi:MAG: zf-HC2 domain-containing protein [Candidatus Omnitrophica bacterium]|nr:zf-HC2 domain-containing protein [Candidatus Omnitrophota bacterium]